MVLNSLQNFQICTTNPSLVLEKMQAVGTLCHILWSCPVISTLWTMTFHLFTHILGIKISLFPGMAIFSSGIESVSASLRGIVINIVHAAGLSLVQHWKDPMPSNIREVIKVTHTHTYEILFASSIGKYQATNTLWKLWTKWYNKTSPDYLLR